MSAPESAPDMERPAVALEVGEDDPHAVPQHNLLRDGVYLLGAAALCCINLGTNFAVMSQIRDYEDFVASLNEPALAVRVAASASYASKIADGGTTQQICNVPYFVDTGRSELDGWWRKTRKFALAVFVLSLFVVAYYLAIKLVGFLRVVEEKHATDAEDSLTDREKRRIKARSDRMEHKFRRADLGMAPTRDMRPGVASRRRERLQLRLETSGFFLVQMIEETPQLLLISMWFNLIHGLKGSGCWNCYTLGEACNVESDFDDLYRNKTILFALCVTFGSMLWNFGSLAHRWFRYARRRNPPFTGAQMTAYFVTGTMVFVSASLAPVLLLFYFFIAPVQWQLAEAVTLPWLIAGCATGGIFAVGFVVFLLFFAKEPGEGMCVGTAWCESGEVCGELPCCEACGEFEAMFEGCPMPCPCC